jgi:AsmA protein
VFEIGRIDAYGGRLAGQFVVNGRNGLSVGGDLILTEVELAPLLDEFVGYDRLEGTGNASLQFLGVGNDIATIMSGPEGQGDFAFGAGALLGFDLAGMIRNFDASFRGDGARTVYDSITANFVISDGFCRTMTCFSMRPGAGSRARARSIWVRGRWTTASFPASCAMRRARPGSPCRS